MGARYFAKSPEHRSDIPQAAEVEAARQAVEVSRTELKEVRLKDCSAVKELKLNHHNPETPVFKYCMSLFW